MLRPCASGLPDRTRSRRSAPVAAALLAALLWAQAGLAAAEPEALAKCRELQRTSREDATSCFSALRDATAPAVRAEAAWALGAMRAAARAFQAAIAQTPQDAAAHSRYGDMLQTAHRFADAEAAYQQALAIDPAHAAAKLGLARIAQGRFEKRAEELAREVLADDPDNLQARLLLARLALEVGDLARAEEELRAPLLAEDLPLRLPAMALAAARDHLRGTAPSPWEARALALHTGYGALFETVAHFYIITRRYRQAVAMLERAVALDPALWSAHATLGMNLLRVNRFADARGALARAHNGFPYNPEVVNTLRLLDSMAEWPQRTEQGVQVRVHPDEAGAIGPYARGIVADAVRVVGARYDHTPQGPVVIELYPRHADFAVRTSGLPGIGILGATFGDVVAMDSPSARGAEEGFDWASVLWHEVAHVITLGATDNLVSRWFSEGVSVLEEWQTGPSRFRLDAEDAEANAWPAVPGETIDAFRADRLLPVATLDEGFIRPTYPGQVAVSYTQAGLLCEHIATHRGTEALAAILRAYRQGADTAQALQTALDTTPEQLDAEFAEHLAQRFHGIDTEAHREALALARKAAQEQDWEAAATAASAAAAAHPHRVDRNSPYPLLAEAREQLGDRQRAVAALTTYWHAGGRSPAALERLADWLEAGARAENREGTEDEAGKGRADAPASGAAEEALAVRRALALVAPLQARHRATLGDRLLAAGQPEAALAEYTAHQSLAPHDAAGAHYRLAKAYFALEQPAQARRHVLSALEIAPRFGDALALLLALNDGAEAKP